MTACDRFLCWEVAQSVDNISKIEIVEIEDGVITSVICEIAPENYEEVVDDVQTRMELYMYSGEPYILSGKAIKITFADDTYDLIACYEPRHFVKQQDGSISSEYSWRFFEANHFDKIINKWIEKS